MPSFLRAGIRTQLEAERQSHYSAQVTVRTLTHELQAARQSHDDDAARLRRSLAEVEAEAERLRSRLREEEERRRDREGNEAVEKRLEVMSAQLLKKQIQLDDMTCAKSALTARLRSAQQRAAKLEQVAAGASASSGNRVPGAIRDYGDLEGGDGGSSGNGGSERGSSLLRQRSFGYSNSTTMSNGIARLPQIAKHRSLARAADRLDRWALWMGLFLKNNAYARLYFLIYVSLLHIWVFFIVTFHAHSFEEVHGDHMMQPSGLLPNRSRPSEKLELSST